MEDIISVDENWNRSGYMAIFKQELKHIVKSICEIDKYQLQTNSKLEYFRCMDIETFEKNIEGVTRLRAWLDLKMTATEIYTRDAKEQLEAKLQKRGCDNCSRGQSEHSLEKNSTSLEDQDKPQKKVAFLRMADTPVCQRFTENRTKWLALLTEVKAMTKQSIFFKAKQGRKNSDQC